MSSETRVIAVTTGSPEVRLLACVLCGVLLWDIDAHYAASHEVTPIADADVIEQDWLERVNSALFGYDQGTLDVRGVAGLLAGTDAVDVEGLASAIFEASHEPPLPDDESGMAEARVKARSWATAYLTHRGAEGVKLRDLIECLIDPDPCWFDHDGGCQAHGYISLEPGEMCPHAEAKEWLATTPPFAVASEGMDRG